MAARRPRIRILAAALALAAAGCGTRPTPPPTPTPTTGLPPATARALEALPLTADEYVKMESSSALLVVQASELAMKRTASGRILEIAARLRRDHLGIAAQLNMAGRRLNLLPPASMLLLDQVTYEGLAREPDFDAAYLRRMKVRVESCVHVNSGFAERGDSPTLRPVARFAARVCADEMNLFP